MLIEKHSTPQGFPIYEIKIDVAKRRSFRTKKIYDYLKHLALANADLGYQSYASVYGHLVWIDGKKFTSISGAKRMDVKFKETKHQFAQFSIFRSLMFVPICARNAYNKYVRKNNRTYPDRIVPRFAMMGYVKFYNASAIQGLINAGGGKNRKISRTAKERGLYKYTDRPKWYRHIPEESVLNSKMLQPEFILLTDSPTEIVAAQDLIKYGITQTIYEQYPSIKGMIKITGTPTPFICGSSKAGNKDPGKRSGEAFFTFSAMKVAEVLIELKKQKYI